MQADIQMPIVVNRRQKQKDSAVSSSGYSGADSDRFVVVQELIDGEKRLWRLEQSSGIASLVEVHDSKPITVPFARLDNSESLSDSSILDSEFLTSLNVGDEEFTYGNPDIFEFPKKVLFSEDIEIKTKELKRWQPEILIDNSSLLEDDE